MTPQEFCYWLQGYFELSPTVPLCGLTQEQAKVVRDHLQLVFQKVTPTPAVAPLSPRPWEWQPAPYHPPISPICQSESVCVSWPDMPASC